MLFIYFVSIIAGIFYGITESINKDITEKKYSVFAYSFIQNFFNFLLYFVPFLFFFKFPAFGTAYIYLIINILLILVGNIFLIKAYKTEDVSNATLLGKSSLVIAFIIGIVLLDEPVTVMKIVGLIFIIIGVVTIFYENRRIRLSSGFLFALTSGILFGFVSYFAKLILRSFTILTYITLNSLIMVSLLFLLPQTRRDFSKIVAKYKKKIIISRLTIVAAIFLFLWSIQNGNISVVNTNMETFYLLSTVCIGIFLLNEKQNLVKKLAGSTLCTLGIILLNFF